MILIQHLSKYRDVSSVLMWLLFCADFVNLQACSTWDNSWIFDCKE